MRRGGASPSPADLTHAVRDGLSSDRPLLIEISQRRIGDA
jgi:hypothetical protein